MCARGPLARIKQIGKATDTTVNDVVLALCAETLREYLHHHNALPDTSLIAMVPVSVRDHDDPGDDHGNKIAAGLNTPQDSTPMNQAHLPGGTTDP